MLNNDTLKKIFDIRDTVKMSALSRKAGIDKDTVSDILHNKTKNPGVYTISKIADALDCSIDELVSDSVTDKKTELKIKLARICITTIVDLLPQEKQQVNFAEFLFILKEIYSYSLRKKAKDVDEKFATQYVNDFLKSKNVKGQSS